MLIRHPIPSSPKVCCSCKRKFEDGEIVFSSLNEGGDGKWQRDTYCGDCRDKCTRRGTVVSVWHGRFSIKPQKQRLPAEMVLELLKRLVGDKAKLATANLFAWHLVRKKYLKHVNSVPIQGGDLNVFRSPDSGETFEIAATRPTDEDLKSFVSLLDEIEELDR